MELKIYNKEGKATTKKVKLQKDIFEVEPNDHAIYLDVKQYLANQRQGTHKTKDKSEITASTRKVKKQKGTGTARMGSLKSGILKGGGRFFGPQPRDYSFKLNKKLKRVARVSALSYKAKDDQIIVLDELSFETPSTKDFNTVISNLELNGTRTLFVTPGNDKNTYLSGRNIELNEVLPASDLNTYQILKAKKIVFIGDALKMVEEQLNN
jgi:large subunit ribosomal protein L4